MIGKIVTGSTDRQPLWFDRGVGRDLGAIAWNNSVGIGLTRMQSVELCDIVMRSP